MCELLTVVSVKMEDKLQRAFKTLVIWAHELLPTLNWQGSAREVAAVGTRSNLMRGRDMVDSLSGWILLQEPTAYQFAND